MLFASVMTEMTLHVLSYVSYLCVNSLSEPGNVTFCVCIPLLHKNINSLDTIWGIIPHVCVEIPFFICLSVK
jgi:hypothetical protein